MYIRSTRPALFCALVIALGACGSSDDGDDSDAGPARLVDDLRTLVPGDIIEGEWEAGPGDRIVIQLEGTRPFGWNIHGHADDETTTIVEELNQTSTSHDFVPPAQTTWNLLVANQGEEALDLTVHMELHGDASWGDWGGHQLVDRQQVTGGWQVGQGEVVETTRRGFR